MKVWCFCGQADMEATAYNGRDRSETMSLEECLHAARRCHGWRSWWTSMEVPIFHRHSFFSSCVFFASVRHAKWMDLFFNFIILYYISHSKRCQDSQHWMMRKSAGKPYISCRFSLNEPSHPRRFLDKKEMDARSKELRAAAIAGIPHDELDYFRAAQLQSSELHKTSRYWYHMWETHEQTGDCLHHP